MNITDIYVNLPVKDVQKTRAFWTELGFSINEQFSNDKAICVVMKKDHIYTMFLKEDFFQTFCKRRYHPGASCHWSKQSRRSRSFGKNCH